MNNEIRWQQRLNNFTHALNQLNQAVNQALQKPLSDLEKQGLIKAFEFTYELAWNVMKDYFFYQGNSEITGSRDAIRESFSKGLIKDGEGWMEMIKSRNQTSHTYNLQIANEIAEKIINQYYPLFHDFSNKMNKLSNKA
ncbi:MAG: nucleotidyltransferase substrate binding protein [Legionella sp.]|jgi:nucleotidyltransferase substrate binding protein (TIGR01987 family)